MISSKERAKNNKNETSDLSMGLLGSNPVEVEEKFLEFKPQDVIDILEVKQTPPEKNRVFFNIDFQYNPNEVQHTSRLMRLFQWSLFSMGIPAGYFYKDYADGCIKDQGIFFDVNHNSTFVNTSMSTNSTNVYGSYRCTYPVSFIPEDYRALALEISGGGGFSGSAAYLGFLAAPAIFRMYNQLNTTSEKVSFVILAVLYAALSAGQLDLGAMGGLKEGESLSDPDALKSQIIPPISVIPMALCSFAMSYPKLQAFRYALADFFSASSVTHEDNMAKKSKEHYKNELKLLQKTIENNWRAIFAEINLADQAIPSADQMAYLMIPRPQQIQSSCEIGGGITGSVLGAIPATVFTGAFTWNTKIQLEKFMPPVVQWPLTVVLGAIMAPPNFELCMEFFADIFKLGPSHSLALKFHPLRTTAVTGLISVLQGWSYSAVFMLLKKLGKEPLADQPQLLFSLLVVASFGIAAYHSMALINLALSALENIPGCRPDPREKYFLDLAKKVQAIQKLTYAQYAPHVEKMSPEQKDLIGVRTFSERSVEPVKSELQIGIETKVIEVKQKVTVVKRGMGRFFSSSSSPAAVVTPFLSQPPRKPEPRKTWCEWWSGKKYRPLVDDVDLSRIDNKQNQPGKN